MIKYVEGDIFRGKEDIIVHGCNCFHTMGSGIAAEVASRYAGAAAADVQYKPKGDRSKLGEYSFCVTAGKTVINGYTQYRFGTGSRYTDYDALRSVMERVNKDFPTKTISMPKIGAGLGGGDWTVIEGIINGVFGEREVTVYLWE